MTNKVLKCLINEQLSTAEIIEILRGGKMANSYFEDVSVEGRTVAVADFPVLTKSELAAVGTAAHESQTAAALFAALDPAFKQLPNLLDEPRIWAWTSLVPMKEYILARWCSGAGIFGNPLPEEIKSGYFLTSRNSLENHARNGARRLYIAARACNGADGDMRNLDKLFKYTDLFTGIFERKIGLDSEMAVEVAIALQTSKEDVRRYTIRSINLMLGTISLEYLSRSQKKLLISDAIADAAARTTS